MQLAMSEQLRARVVAGSMSALMAGVVAALLLGVAVVSGHFLRPLGAGGSDTTVRVPDRAVKPGAISTPVVGPAAPAIGAVANPAPSPGGHHQHHHPRPGCRGCGSGGSGGSPPIAKVGADAGPVNATASVGSTDSSVSAQVGPVRVKKKIHTGPIVKVAHTVGTIVCALLTC
jgi:hypothetical protein